MITSVFHMGYIFFIYDLTNSNNCFISHNTSQFDTGVIQNYETGPSMVEVMTHRLMASNYYWNQYWLSSTKFSDIYSNLMRKRSGYLWLRYISNRISKFKATPAKDQGINGIYIWSHFLVSSPSCRMSWWLSSTSELMVSPTVQHISGILSVLILKWILRCYRITAINTLLWKHR